MAERFDALSLATFAKRLAAKQAVPGGGGVAALAGALAASLAAMVGNYTIGKRAYAAQEESVRRLVAEAAGLSGDLLALVQADADAFLPLSRAYAIPRDDPRRADVLEEATKGAIEAPLKMMRGICHTIEVLEEMGEKGSTMLVSDVGVGSLMARAALEAAAMNVFVNTKTLRDRAYAEEIEDECTRLLDEYVRRAELLSASVMERIRA